VMVMNLCQVNVSYGYWQRGCEVVPQPRPMLVCLTTRIVNMRAKVACKTQLLDDMLLYGIQGDVG